RKFFFVRGTSRLLSGETVRRHVRVDESRVHDLTPQVVRSRVGGNRDLTRRADGLDDSAAHDHDARIESPAGRRENAGSGQREGETIAAPDVARGARDQRKEGCGAGRRGGESEAPTRGFSAAPHRKRADSILGAARETEGENHEA